MTLTTERLREIAEDGFLEHGDAKLMARELLANREAQPVAENAQIAGYFVRQRPEWDKRAPWTPWKEVDAASYDDIVKIIATGEAYCGWFYDTRILYDAPPAPAALPVQHYEELCRQHPNMSIGDAIIRAAWWNHCCAELLKSGTPPAPAAPDDLVAAVNLLLDCDGTRGHFSAIRCGDAREEVERLLAQPVSQGYTLQDGWIACSERMPELDKRVLLYFGSYDGHIEDGCIGDDGDGPYHYFFDGDSLQQEPTHWMPLPIAQEGGNDE